MIDRLSRFVDQLSEYLAERKGLIPMIGILLVVINLIFEFIPGLDFLTRSDIFLHIGVIVSIFGLMLARVL
jgi:hypothetical protein